MSAFIQLPHIVTSYDDDLHRLRSTISQMGALCETQLTAAIDALAEADAEGAAAVVSLDERVDALHGESESAAIGILARHAPLADDLREVVATLKIAGWLERVGDYAKSIAWRTATLAALDAAAPAALTVGLAASAKLLLRRSLNAYIDRDDALAAAVITEDGAIDQAYASTFAALLSFGDEHAGTLAAVTHLQFIAKNFERIADQATNIAEQVVFTVTGVMALDRFGAGSAAGQIPG